jgi:hypothetical protein
LQNAESLPDPAVLTWFYLPDSPTSVKWADAELKTKLVERVRANDQGLKQKKFRKDQAWEAAKDPYTYCLFGLALCQTLVVGGLGKFNRWAGSGLESPLSRTHTQPPDQPRFWL